MYLYFDLRRMCARAARSSTTHLLAIHPCFFFFFFFFLFFNPAG
jgi:hypothetical protein